MEEDLEFGPVELVLATYDGDRPDAGVIEAIASLVDAGTVRMIDVVQVSRDHDGTVRFSEFDDSTLGASHDDELAASGLVSQDDIEALGEQLPPGASALLVAVELVWAKHLASKLAQANGAVVDSVRVPAPVVNAVVAEARASAQAS